MEFPQRRRTPSFSSSLLDAIYRSIDQSDGLRRGLGGHYTETTSRKNNTVPSPNNKDDNSGNHKLTSLRRAIMNEDNWARRRSSSCGVTHHSASSSSDSSSSAATFSSSEAESYDKEKRSRKSEKLAAQGKRSDPEKQKSQKAPDGKFSRRPNNNLQAVKIYEELKKSKQPVSPGARLTGFINSIFQSNAKKVKLCSVGATKDVSLERKSKSSSRSCFSRTRRNSDDSSGNNNDNTGMKRSVRFYPVSVIEDKDCRTCGQKNIHEKDPTLMPGLMAKKKVGKRPSLEDELKIREREMTCNTSKFDLKHFVRSYKGNDDDEDEDEDDVWSYSSSDLFELDHRIGIACRYREELPVYETTDLKTNQAIARGLIL